MTESQGIVIIELLEEICKTLKLLNTTRIVIPEGIPINKLDPEFWKQPTNPKEIK